MPTSNPYLFFCLLFFLFIDDLARHRPFFLFLSFIFQEQNMGCCFSADADKVC